MAALKPFTTSDITVVPFIVNKSFTFVGSSSFEESNVGIDRLIGTYIPNSSPFTEITEPTTGFIGTYYQRDIYSSIKQLYYTNYIPNPISGSLLTYEVGGVAGFNVLVEDYTTSNVYSRFYNYENTTLSQSRYFPTESGAQVGVISIPSKLFGEYINPNTFSYKFLYNGLSELELFDNGEGIIVDSSKSAYGIINYQHGTIVITDTYTIDPSYFTSSLSSPTCSFQSSRTIYETQYKCTIRPEEFNFSLNPSLISGSTEGTVYNFVTGSYFSPYVTTVGFYNEAQELLMVAKLGQPLPTSQTTDTTILVNIDK